MIEFMSLKTVGWIKRSGSTIPDREGKMKKICPYCEDAREIEIVEKIEKVNVRGETIEVLAHPYHCLVCRGVF